jgi:hypothetical protein
MRVRVARGWGSGLTRWIVEEGAMAMVMVMA